MGNGVAAPGPEERPLPESDKDTDRLRVVLDNLPGLVAFLDGELRYRLANRAHFNWFGEEPGALLGRPKRDIVGNAAWEVLASHYEEAQAGRQSAYMGQVPYARGGNRFVHSVAVPVEGSDGGILALVTDLTEHHLIEKALDATTRRTDVILETAVDGIITIDAKGIIQSMNRAAEKLFGYSAREVVGRNVNILMPAPYAEAHDGYIERYLATGERRIIGIGREVTGLRKDGSEFPMELAVGEFVQDGRHFFTGFTRDITARRAAEAEARQRLNQLAQVARMSSMGDLATGIAHEVNQPLTAIVTLTHALTRKLRAGDCDAGQLERTLEKVAHQGVRASTIIHQLRQFIGKGAAGQTGMHAVEDVIADVLDLLRYELDHHGIETHVELAPDSASLPMNRIQIEQVLVNLVQNAVDALRDCPGTRSITVITRCLDEGFTEVFIADNGPGLDEESCQRAFEPFFTTRADGMGQGLSICKSIVEAHGGTIRARNDEGAVFSFTLPLTAPGEP